MVFNLLQNILLQYQVIVLRYYCSIRLLLGWSYYGIIGIYVMFVLLSGFIMGYLYYGYYIMGVYCIIVWFSLYCMINCMIVTFIGI